VLSSLAWSSIASCDAAQPPKTRPLWSNHMSKKVEPSEDVGEQP
jgi:hypothetical protein